MRAKTTEGLNAALRSLADAGRMASKSLDDLAVIVNRHREQWLCTSPGQWPDVYALLNRYVRTNLEPPFIINC